MLSVDRYKSIHGGTWEEAVKLADSYSLDFGLYLPVDNGPYHSPRYGVLRAFKVGDNVSKGFNGDYYPEGWILSISDSQRLIRTSTGLKFYRYKLSAIWRQSGGTWSLVLGHIDERNPCF